MSQHEIVQAPLRALVIGAGPAAVQMHLPILAGLRDKGALTLMQVCDLQPERVAAARRNCGFLEGGADAAASLSRTDIDVVYIFASAQLHHQLGLRALQAGKHLFVEKPIAPGYVEAHEMAAMAAERGLIAVGGHNRRFYASLTELRESSNKAGWRYAEAVFHKPELGKAPPYGARTWLGANGIHALDALVFMMGGLPERLLSLAGTSRAGQAFSALLHWHDGRQAVFACNNAAGARREAYVFHGPGVTYTVTDTEVRCEKQQSRLITPAISLGDGVRSEHDAFLQAIRGASPPAHSLAALAPSLYLGELIEAGFSGEVRLPQRRSPGSAGTNIQAAAGIAPKRPTAFPSPPQRVGPHAAILVVNPASLQSSLGQLHRDFDIVGIQQIEGLPGPCPEVRAAILGSGAMPLSDEVLRKLPALEVVGMAGLSVARQGAEELLRRGITVLNASAAYAESVAEFAFGLAILARRRAFVSHEVMRAGGWGHQFENSSMFEGFARRTGRRLRPALQAVGLEHLARNAWRAFGSHSAAAGSAPARSDTPRELQGATVGLIGWGANARAFARRLIAAGAHVFVYSEHGTAADIQAAGATAASLAEVLAAEIVSLHRGLTVATRHFLGAAELERLRPGAILLNVARGGLIEPGALLSRLRRGDVFACLDTYEIEPLAAAHPLRSMRNVFLTSHIAGGSSDLRAAAAAEVVAKVASFLCGGAVDTVTIQQFGTMS